MQVTGIYLAKKWRIFSLDPWFLIICSREFDLTTYLKSIQVVRAYASMSSDLCFKEWSLSKKRTLLFPCLFFFLSERKFCWRPGWPRGERPKQELTEISIRRWNRCHWFKNSPIRFFADFYPFSKVVFFFKSQGNALRPLPSVEKKILFCFFSFGASAPVFRSWHEEHDSNGSNYINLRIPLTLSPNKPSLIRA